MTTWQRSGQFLFVHAGLNPTLGENQIHQAVGIDLTDRFDESSSTRWIRKPFHRHQPGPSGWYGSFVVHGHDPDDGQMPYAQMRNRCRLNLDGGSYRTKQSRMATIEKNHIQRLLSVTVSRRSKLTPELFNPYSIVEDENPGFRAFGCMRVKQCPSYGVAA